MRKLNFKDMFAVAEIIRKAKIRSELAALISGISTEKAAKTDKTAESAGKGEKNTENLVEKVGIPAVESEIYALIASIRGVDVEVVQNMSIDEIRDFWGALVAENDLNSFFASAVSSQT